MNSLVNIEVQRLTREWVDGPEMNVVAHPRDLPVGGVHAHARGMFWRRKVWIVADQPQSLVAATVAHEVVAHFALRDVLGRGWRRFALAVHKAASKGGDVFLRKLRRRVRHTYANPTLAPRFEADEIIAAIAEDAFDRRTARLCIHDPISAQFEAIVGMIARDVLRADLPATSREVEGALLLAEHRLRYGGLCWGAGYRVRRFCRWLLVTLGLCGAWWVYLLP